MYQPAVSVVIPVFNRPAPVRRAVRSVLSQTHQDFEVVIVDDGSTDETPASLRTFGGDPRVRVIRHERSRGGGAARNTGIRACAAKYVAFLDSDDEWLPAKLGRQLERFERADRSMGLVYTAVEMRYLDGSAREWIPEAPAALARALLTTNAVGGASVGMLRRDVLLAIGGFDESLSACQDWDLWLRVLDRCRADLVPEVLVRVASDGDPGRISANLRGVLQGRERLGRKHRERFRSAGVLHRYLRESGWIYQRLLREPGLARRRYAQSLAVRPLAAPTYLLLASTFMPKRWLDTTAAWKWRATEWWRSAREHAPLPPASGRAAGGTE